MATPVIMPRQGQSVESCIITKWHKKVGDKVSIGDILLTYETDKATFDEEAKVEGTFLGTFFEVGDDVPCLINICAIGAPGEAISALAPNGATESQVAQDTQVATVSTTAAETVETPIVGHMKISPRAKSLASKSNADLSKITASGPDGRVIERDVQKLIASGLLVTPAASSAYEGGLDGTGIGGRVSLKDINKPTTIPETKVAAQEAPVKEDSYEVPLTNIRKMIAKAMHQSLSSMAQLTHNLSFDCTEILAVRKKFKEQGAAFGMDKITLNDIILFAVARTLAQETHKALNAHFLDDRIRYFRSVNLGMAVDTERGLMVPTLFNANKLSLKEISVEAKKLASQCQEGTISPDLIRGGTFTVSNLGALEIETFTPVINPPQTGILGVNTITTRVKEVNGQLVGYQAMSLSLTYDHRAIDGAPASRFLCDLKKNLENFTLTLARG